MYLECAAHPLPALPTPLTLIHFWPSLNEAGILSNVPPQAVMVQAILLAITLPIVVCQAAHWLIVLLCRPIRWSRSKFIQEVVCQDNLVRRCQCWCCQPYSFLQSFCPFLSCKSWIYVGSYWCSVVLVSSYVSSLVSTK